MKYLYRYGIPERIYNSIVFISFLLLFIGLPMSKFLITIGITGLILSSIYPIFIIKTQWNLKKFEPFYFLVICYIILIISILYSNDTTEGWKELWIQNGILTVPVFTVVHWEVFKKYLNQFLRAFLSVSFFASLVTLFFYACPIEMARTITDSFSFFQDYPDLINKTQFGLYSPFIDRLHFAYIISFAFLYSLYSVLKSGSLQSVFLILFFGITLLNLGARGAQLALLIAMVPFVFYGIKELLHEQSYFSLKSIVIVMIFLILIPLFSYQLIPSVRHRYNQMMWEIEVINNDSFQEYDYQYFTTLTRLKSVQNSWELIKKNFLFGVGIGDVKDEMAAMYKKISPNIPIHHQNYYLYLWLCGGLPALIFYLAFLVSWVNFIWREQNALLKIFALSYWIFVVLIMMFDVVLKYHIGVFSIPLLIMSTAALNDVKRPHDNLSK